MNRLFIVSVVVACSVGLEFYVTSPRGEPATTHAAAEQNVAIATPPSAPVDEAANGSVPRR